MKKRRLFILATIGLFSCKQSSTANQNIVDTPKLSSPKTVQSQEPYQSLIDTRYEYSYTEGGRVLIENSLSKGEQYTDPNGNEYFKTIFWSRIFNETDDSLELKIDFPGDSYEVRALPGKYFKILVLPDTMSVDKVPLFNYGIDLKSFIDNSFHKPSSWKQHINPKGSSGFYVVVLFDKGVGGPIRTGLSIKGQNLFYRVSRLDAMPAHSLMVEKEINCGSINLKNLVPLGVK